MSLFFKRKKLPLAIMLSVATTASATAAMLEEVVVTAQKRQQSMQDIPIAMSAFNADNIESMGLGSAKDIGLATPSLQMPTYPTSSNNLALFIRGIGNADSVALTKDNTVGVYYDGIYAGRNSGLLADLADLERVEVLRGPQGTLYGRNTTSGAINFINAKPTGELGVKQALTVGDFGIFRSVTNVNLPDAGGFKAKLTAAFSDRDGWVENDGPNKVPSGEYEDYYSEDKEGYRLALRFDGVEGLVVDYAFDYSDMTTGAPYFQYAGDFGGADAAGNPITNSFVERLEETRTPTGGTRLAYYLPPTETEVKGHNLTISYELSDSLTIKSLSGYREFDDNSSTNFSQAFGDAGSLEINTATEHEQFSQELQLLGSYDRVTFVTGLYYLEEEGTQTERQFLDRNTVDSTAIFALDLTSTPAPTPCSIFGQGGNGAGGLAPACAAPFTATFPLFLGQYAMTSDVESIAAFGQATWTLNDALDVTAGLRYTEDERSTARTNDSWAYNSFSPGAVESDLDELDGSLVFDYRITDSISTYAKAATAFRSGGAGRNSLDYNQGFDKETLISYELGWKMELADRRLRLNGAIFQMQIDDIILDNLPDPVNSPQFVDVFNSGEAEINGLELDLLAAVTENFTIGFNYAFLDHEIKDAIFPDGSDRTANTELVWAPEHAYSFIADYGIPLSFGTLNLHLDYSWQDDQLALANTEFGRVEVSDYGLLNARISLGDIAISESNLRVALWSRNLADEDSVNYRIGTTSTTHLQPRTIGADVILEF